MLFFFLRSFSYTPHVFNEEYLTLLMVVPVRCFSYTPHADHSEQFQSHTATSPAGSARISSLIFSSWWIQTRRTFFLYYNYNDDTDAIPDVMLIPNKDARARSDRLQLGTAHIQSFTQTRQVSVVMGMTRFWAAIGS